MAHRLQPVPEMLLWIFATGVAQMESKPESEGSQDVYEMLAKAAPQDKADIVIHLIESRSDHKLVLPQRDGIPADLSHIDLDQQTLARKDSAMKSLWFAWAKDGRLGAQLANADLRGANLTGAKFYGATLTDADLRGADLRSADFSGVNLSGANLNDANMKETIVESADLSGAMLRGASLEYGSRTWARELG